MFEQKVDISELVAPDMFGTVDIRIAEPFGKLHIIDYKHGRGVPVEAEGNTQLIYYALGSAAEDDFNFEEVEMTIVQPRCPHAEGSIRTWVLSMDELLSYVDKFKVARRIAEKAEEEIVAAGKPVADLVEAGKWCKFCPAKAICPAQYKQTIEMAQIDFDDGEFTMAEVDFDSLTEEQILKVLEVGDDVKKYVDAVISMAHTMLENGKELPGWKLVKKRANAKFVDDDLTVIGKLSALGFPENQTTRMKLQTLTSLRKTCGKEVIEKLTYKPDNGTTIAPESDKREAVIPSAISDFDD